MTPETIIYLLFISLTALTTADTCAKNALDINPGYNSSMTPGAVLKYSNDALLLAATNPDGAHIFLFSPLSDTPLSIVSTISTERGIFFQPFVLTTSYLYEAMYQVFINGLRDSMLYYTYGTVGDLQTVVIDKPGAENALDVKRFGDRYFYHTRDNVYEVDVVIGNITRVLVDRCRFPRRLAQFSTAVPVSALICANITNALYPDLFLWANGSFIKYESNVNDTKIMYSSFQEVDGFVYFVGENLTVWRTDFQSDMEFVSENIGFPVSLGNVFFYSKFGEGDGIFPGLLNYFNASGDLVMSLRTPVRDDKLLNWQGKLYFVADCDGNLRGDQVLCVLDLNNWDLEWYSAYIDDEEVDFGSVRSIFLKNEKVFLAANTPTTGTELFVIDSTAKRINLAHDIFRGRSSSSPSDFQQLGEDIYFIAQDIYVGREIFEIVTAESCDPENLNVIDCSGDCDFGNNDADTIYTGYVFINIDTIANVISTTTVEGGLFAQGSLNISAGINILGSLSLGRNATLTLNSRNITVRGCIRSENASLVLRVEPSDVENGFIEILEGNCIQGTFGSITILQDDECQEITVTDFSANQGLQITFTGEDICPEETTEFDPLILIILIVSAVLLLIVIGVLVAIGSGRSSNEIALGK